MTESHVPKSMRLTSFVSFFVTTPVTRLRIAGENSASYSWNFKMASKPVFFALDFHVAAELADGFTQVKLVRFERR